MNKEFYFYDIANAEQVTRECRAFVRRMMEDLEDLDGIDFDTEIHKE